MSVAFVMTLLPVFGVGSEASEPTSLTIREIPITIAQELRSRNCKAPNKKSVIHGQFFTAGQSDWVALCSSKTNTTLLVFPGGSRERVAVVDTKSKGFSKWSIGVISQEQLKSTWALKQPLATAIDHDGISSFVEFGETGACLYCYSAEGSVYYNHQGGWLTAMSAIVN
jgi:hypothetical protein